MNTELQPRFLDAAPGLYVTDLTTSAAFYEGILGFVQAYSNEAYVVLHRDAVSVHLSVDRAQAGNGFCTLFVSQVAALFSKCVDAGATVIRPLESSSYGLDDFVVADPDGNEILIGERR